MWVRAPGLMTIPRASFRFDWMKSMSAPSWFDWNASTLTFQPSAGLADHRLDLGQRRAAVDLRLALAEQVQVGTVDQQDHRAAFRRAAAACEPSAPARRVERAKARHRISATAAPPPRVRRDVPLHRPAPPRPRAGAPSAARPPSASCRTP